MAKREPIHGAGTAKRPVGKGATVLVTRASPPPRSLDDGHLKTEAQILAAMPSSQRRDWNRATAAQRKAMLKKARRRR
jgi:hypothetical protein